MPFNLSTFSKQVPPDVLAQGRAHVAAAQVHNLELDGIEWLADVVVPDAESYSVAVAVGPRGELLATCTCDDEEHELCRHAVATLLAAVAQGQAAELPAGKSKKKTKSAKKPAKTTAAGRLRAALEAAPHATLVDILINLSSRDKFMQNQILLEVTDVGASLETYRTAVKNALSPRGGWRAWYDARIVTAVKKQMESLIGRADMALSEGDVDGALRMAVVVIQEIMRVLNSTDYSLDVVDDFGERPYMLIAENCLRASDAGHDALFQSLLEFVQNRHGKQQPAEDILHIMIDIVKTPAERQTVEALLKPPEAQTYYGRKVDETVSSVANNYTAIHYLLIRKLDGDAAANHFARKNMHFYILRNTLIEQAAVAQDWATVQRLATDGLKWSDANKLQPLSQYYRSHLIKATESQGKPATNQLLTQFLATERLADYERWKASIPAEEWPLVRASLLSVNALRAETTYAILVHEEAWEEMMNWALGSPSDMRTINDVLDAHGATLIERFPDDVARWCVMGIEKVLDKYTNNRNDYRTIADLLERMVEMGLGKQAAQEAALLREIYSNRPALLQELQNV